MNGNGRAMPHRLRGRGRLLLLQCHRLQEFEEAFSGYLAGTVPDTRVTERARLLLQCGPPGQHPRRRKAGHHAG